ncbi:DUF4405 domain-containing protein [Desulfovibrio sp. 1214_IL3152]
MLVLFLASLGFRLTEEKTHEWLGMALFTLFAVLTWINRRWYTNLFKGKYTLRRLVNTAVNLSLLGLMLLLAAGGMMNSRFVLSFLELKGGMQYREWHTLAAYWGLVIIGIHTGMHWSMISGFVRKMTGNALLHPVTLTALRILAFTVLAFGIWASFDREMGAKLFLGFGFDYWDMERPAVLFYASAFSIMALYAFITHLVMRLAGKLVDTAIPLAASRPGRQL